MVKKITPIFFLLLFAFDFANSQDSTARKKQKSSIAVMP